MPRVLSQKPRNIARKNRRDAEKAALPPGQKMPEAIYQQKRRDAEKAALPPGQKTEGAIREQERRAKLSYQSRCHIEGEDNVSKFAELPVKNVESVIAASAESGINFLLQCKSGQKPVTFFPLSGPDNLFTQEKEKHERKKKKKRSLCDDLAMKLEEKAPPAKLTKIDQSTVGASSLVGCFHTADDAFSATAVSAVKFLQSTQ